MEDLKRQCEAGEMPGIRKLHYCSANEVEKIIITARDTVKVTLKQGCSWGEVEGVDTTAESQREQCFENRVTTTLPGWTAAQAAGIGRLARGRYIVKWEDGDGEKWMCGHGEPMRLNVNTKDEGDAQSRKGVELDFRCKSEWGFLKLEEQ